MSLDKPDIIDAIGTDKVSDNIILSIIDSWDWQDEYSHLIALQNKLNNYFAFIESGEIIETYPKSKDKKIIIDVITKYPLPENATALLEKAAEIATNLVSEIRHHQKTY